MNVGDGSLNSSIHYDLKSEQKEEKRENMSACMWVFHINLFFSLNVLTSRNCHHEIFNALHGPIIYNFAVTPSLVSSSTS